MAGPTSVGGIQADITADASGFRREAAEVRTEARELGALSPNVDVHANVGPALVGLAAVAKAERDLDVAFQRSSITQRKLDAVTQKYGEDSLQAASARLAMTRATNAEHDAEARLTAARSEATDATERDTAATNNNVRSNNQRISGIQVLLALAPAILAATAPIGAAAIGLGSAFGVMAAAGVFAFKGIQNEMAQGTAVGEQYTAGLHTMSQSMDALKHTAAVAMLGQFNDATQTLTGYMPILNSMVGEFAGQLGIVGNTALKGILSGLNQLNPLIQAGAVQLGDFVSWLTGFTADNGFSSFVQYAVSNLPPVMTMIEGLVRLAGNILVAFAPLGPVMVGFITLLTDIGNALPGPVLAGFLSTVLLIAPALKLAFNEGVASAIGKVAISIGLTGVAANLAVPVVGILTAAIAGLGVGVMAASMDHQQATVALTDYTQAVKDDSDAIGANVRATAAKALQDAGAFDAATKLGISQSVLTNATLGNAGAQAKVTAQVALAQSKIDDAANATSGYVSATTDSTNASDGFVGAIKTVNDAVDSNNQQIQKAVAGAKNMAAAMADASNSAGYQLGAEQALAVQHGISATAYQNAVTAQAAAKTQLDQTTADMYVQNDAAGLLKQAWDLLNGKTISAAQAQNTFDSSLANMGDHMSATGKKITFTTTSINDQSAASVSLRGQLIGQVNAMEGVIEANGGLTKVTATSRGEYIKMRQDIIDNAVAHGVNRDAVTKFINTLFKIPPVTLTQTEVNTDEAMSKITAFRNYLNATNGNRATAYIDVITQRSTVNVPLNSDTGGSAVQPLGGHFASGGPISYLASGGFPGQPIGRDTVPIWGEPGEFMLKRASAQSLGAPALKYMNDTGKLPPNGGGMVTVNLVLDGKVIDTRIVNLSQQTASQAIDSFARDIRNRR